VGTNYRLHLRFCFGVFCLVVLSSDSGLSADWNHQAANSGGSTVYLQPMYSTGGGYSAYGGRFAKAPGSCVTLMNWWFSGVVSAGNSVRFEAYSASSGGTLYGSSAAHVLSAGTETWCDTFNGTGFDGGSSPVSNFVHCVNWTNNTGSSKGIRIYDSVGSVIAIAYVQPEGRFNQCYTNQNSSEYLVAYPPYQGAPEDEWIAPEGVDTITSFTSGSGVTGTGPSNNSFQSTITNGNTSVVGTNLVVYYSPTTNGSGVGASQADIRQLGDALIRALGPPLSDIARNTWLQYQHSLTNGSGGGSGSDAGTTNAINTARDSITNSIQRLDTNFNMLATNLQALSRSGTNGLGTNSFGTNGSAYGDGSSSVSSAYGSHFTSMSNQVGSAFTNSMSDGDSGLLLNFQSAGAPTASLTVLDLRPSSLGGPWRALAACCRVMLSLAFLVGLYWSMWTAWRKESMLLEQLASGVGKALSGASVGALVATPVRFAVASIVTVGLAGFPSLLLAAVTGFGLNGVTSVSPITLAHTTAGGISTATADAMVGGWHLLLQIFPWSTMTTCVINYLLFRISMVWFSTIWANVLRLLPVLILSAVTVQGSQWIIDNRLHVPVGCIIGGETHWFPMGETRCELAASFSATHGGATNVGSVSASGSEWTRVIIWESSTNTLAVSTSGEDGFNTTFTRGFGFGLTIVLFAIVIHVGRRAVRMPVHGAGD